MCSKLTKKRLEGEITTYEPNPIVSINSDRLEKAESEYEADIAETHKARSTLKSDGRSVRKSKNKSSKNMSSKDMSKNDLRHHSEDNNITNPLVNFEKSK